MKIANCFEINEERFTNLEHHALELSNARILSNVLDFIMLADINALESDPMVLITPTYAINLPIFDSKRNSHRTSLIKWRTALANKIEKQILAHENQREIANNEIF
jgi:hypothetical protein